jgi:hypothetical protein
MKQSSNAGRAEAEADAGRPFGSDPTRSRLPLIFFAALYVLWFGALAWMAIDQYGRR